MIMHRHVVGEVSVPTPTETVPPETDPAERPLPLDAPPVGPHGTTTGTTPATPLRPRRRTRRAWLVGAGATCLVVIAAVLGLRIWDLDGQVSDLNDENGSLTAEIASLDSKVSELTAERDSIQEFFPISQESMAAADLEGTYDALFVPVEGACTYSDCDQFSSARFPLSIARTSEGYALGLEGVPGPPAPMSPEGTVYTTSGVLPESMWGNCDGVPAETSFEMHLAVAAVGLAGSDLQAVEASGTYRQYTPYTGLPCDASESSATFTARRTG